MDTEEEKEPKPKLKIKVSNEIKQNLSKVTLKRSELQSSSSQAALQKEGQKFQLKIHPKLQGQPGAQSVKNLQPRGQQQQQRSLFKVGSTENADHGGIYTMTASPDSRQPIIQPQATPSSALDEVHMKREKSS